LDVENNLDEKEINEDNIENKKVNDENKNIIKNDKEENYSDNGHAYINIISPKENSLNS